MLVEEYFPLNPQSFQPNMPYNLAGGVRVQSTQLHSNLEHSKNFELALSWLFHC